MILLYVFNQLPYFTNSAMNISGSVVAFADLANTNIDIISQINDSCIQIYTNNGGLEKNTFGDSVGSDANLVAGEQICVNQTQKIIKTHIFDFNKNGLLDILITIQDAKEYQNLIYLQNDDQHTTSKDKLFNGKIVKIITQSLPQPLHLTGNYAPDLVYEYNNSLIVLKNNMYNHDLRLKCIEDNTKCFISHEFKSVNYTLLNQFYQIDANNDCLSEFFISVITSQKFDDLVQQYNEQLTTLNHSELKISDPYTLNYLVHVELNFDTNTLEPKQYILLGSDVSVPTFYDVQYTGNQDIVAIKNTETDSYLFLYSNTQKKRERTKLCQKDIKYEYKFTLTKVTKLTAKTNLKQKPYISDFKFDRSSQIYILNNESKYDIFQFKNGNFENITHYYSQQNGSHSVAVQVDLNKNGHQALFFIDTTKYATQVFQLSKDVKDIYYYIQFSQQQDFCFASCRKYDKNQISSIVKKSKKQQPLNSYVPGANFQYSISNLSYELYHSASVMSQPSEYSIQVPYITTSIGQKAQYIDYFYSGNIETFRQQNGIIPKATIIVNTFGEWRYQIFLPRVPFSEIVIAAISTVVLTIFLVVVISLWCREQREDRADKVRLEQGFK